MRILIPSLHHFPDLPSGSTRLGYDEAIALARAGHEVWMIVDGLTNDTPEYTEVDGLHVLRYGHPAARALLDRLEAHQRATADLLKRRAPADFDLIHGHSPLQYDGALKALGGRAVTAYSIHSPALLEARASVWRGSLKARVLAELRGQMWARVERRTLEQSSIITSDSHYTKIVMTELYGEKLGSRIEVFPGWVSEENFIDVHDSAAVRAQLGWTLGIPTFFTLRRLVPRNGIQTLIEAAHLLKTTHPRFKVMIGGNGPLKDELNTLIGSLGLIDHVALVGSIPSAQLSAAYAAADVFVLPTAMLECFGLIILEAFAAGTPVIGTPVGSIPELIRPVEPGWIAEANTAEALAALMRDSLDEKLPLHPPERLRAHAHLFDHDHTLRQLVERVTRSRA